MALSEHLEKLRYFNKVCSNPSIQSAAKSIGISQAGLSKSIQSLEQALGVTLFIRSNEGLILTESGRVLQKSCEAILTEALNTEAALKLLSNPKTPQTIRFGMYDSIAVYFFAELSKYLRIVYPQVKLNMTIERSGQLCSKIEAGYLDIAVGVNFDKMKEADLEYLQLWEDCFGFFVSPQISDPLEELPLIYYPDAIDEAGVSCEEHLSVVNRSRVRAYNFETIKSLAVSSLGCGILPLQVARPLVVNGTLKQTQISSMKQTFGKHSIGLLVRKSFLSDYEGFAKDLYHLGISWAKA